MWILPRQLHTSAFVPDTEALISDSTEQSEICAQSLLARSKPSPARTWSQRWKRDSWTQHLSGRILKPSHGPSFVTAWTSSLAATRASHSAQPASASAPKTHDTSGRLSQPELLQCDQQYVSLKTSRDISALGYPTLSKTWTDWVTERRGAWRQRVNAARLTRGSGSLSWPTMHMGSNERGAYYDKTGKGQRYLSDAVVDEQKNWPSPVASEVRQGFQDRSKGMKGSQESLTTVVIKHGQAAPASSNTLGSRQGLLVDWRTPQAQEAGAKVETLFTKDGTPAMPGQRAYRKTPSGKLVLQSQTINQQVEMVQRHKLWPTARSLDGSVNESLETWTARHHRKEAEGINLHRPLPIAVMQEQQKQWATPRSGKTTDENPETWALRQAKGDVATMPLTAQVKQWATPRTPTGGPESAQRKQELGRTTSGGGDLASQAMTQWPTPMTLAGPTETSNVSGSSEFTRKVDVLLGLRETTNGKRSPTAGKLNPRWVETLMGLPIGWTMPSCIRPVTIAPTSCDSSGMALCQPSQSERSDFLLAS
jgi:hypothetical protein